MPYLAYLVDSEGGCDDDNVDVDVVATNVSPRDLLIDPRLAEGTIVATSGHHTSLHPQGVLRHVAVTVVVTAAG